MRLLVTGATGFIGGHVIRELAGSHEVLALCHTTPPASPELGVTWIQQDLTEPLDASKLPERVDGIIHLAQSRYYRQFPDMAKDIFDVNVHGTFQLLEYARRAGVESFIFASTGGINGYSYEKFVETDPVIPQSFYLSSKYIAELLIANYQRFFRTVVLRFFFVYGPGQKSMLIPTLLSKVQNGETIVIEGNPGLRINPIFVGDAIRVFEPALHFPTSALFNVAGDEAVTITDLVKLMERVSGKKALVQHTAVDPRRHVVGDNTQMKSVLGAHPKTPLLEGLSYML